MIGDLKKITASERFEILQTQLIKNFARINSSSL